MKLHQWTQFESAEAQCNACRLRETSACYKLKGEGPRGSRIALVGEAPGWTEERDERPFVGRAGQLLDGCITEAGLNRDHLFLTNAVRCRPINPNNQKDRKPTLDEVDACRAYTLEEMRSLRPRVIVALGDTASSMLLSKKFGGIQQRRGKATWSDEWDAWIVETLHPSFALRQYAQRHFIIEDLKHARRISLEGGEREASPTEIEVVWTLNHLERVRDEILAASAFHFDWETYGPKHLDPTRGDNENGLHLTKARGFCLSIATREGHAYVIPRYLQNITPYWGRSLNAVDDLLREIFLSPCSKGGFHVSFDISITQSTLGVKPTNVTFCGMVAHHAINNHLGSGAHGLKSCAALYTPLGRYDDELDNWLIENGYTREGKPDHDYIYKAPDKIVHKYNGIDSDASLRLEHVFVPHLHEEGLWKIFTTDLMPVALEHQEIDRIGPRINVPYLEEVSGILGDGLVALKAQITEAARAAGHIAADADFNPNSHDQVAALLYDAQGLPILARTDGGKPSTKEEIMLQLRDMSDYIPLILQFRAFTKVKGTWIDGTKSDKGQKKALRAVLDEDGHARMSTMVTGTETFRFVTRKPFAVHTFPKTVKGMPSVRALIIPEDGYTFLDADFMQQELAIQAILSGQEDMVEAIVDRGEDAHEAVSYDLGGVRKSDFFAPDGIGGYEFDGHLWIDRDAYNTYKSIRSKWKGVSFMVMFRGGAKKLARMALGCTGDYRRGVVCKVAGSTDCDCERTAQDWINAYYDRYDKIKWWQYCVAPQSKILHSNLSWTRADEVHVGDELIGFDEKLEGKGQVRNSCFRSSVVEGVRRLHRQCYRVETTRGTVVASAEHLWVVRKRRSKKWYTKRAWVSTSDLKVNDEIAFLSAPWEYDASREAGELAGFFDGEGSVDKVGHCVSYAQNPGRTERRIKTLLRARGFQFSRHKNTSVRCLQYGLTDRESMLRFLGSIRPLRLLAKSRAIWEGRRTWARKTSPARVLKITPLGKQEVIAIQTSTRTLVVEGFLSHNSVIKKGYETGRSWTPFGTYRKLPAFFDADRYMQYEAERQACNAPIQISGAHVMRRAMLGIQARFRKEKFPGRVVMSIHDELITEVRTDLLAEGEYIVRRYMEQPFPELAGRSLRVDVARATCWGG